MSVTTLIEGQKYRVEVSGGPGKDGKPARITRIVYGTEGEAREVEADLKARKNALAALGRNPQMGEYVDAYIADRSQFYDVVAAKTQDSWRGILRTQIRPYMGDRYVMDIRPADIRTFFRWLMGTKGLAGETVRKTHGLLRLVFNQAVEDGLISANPCHVVKAPKSDTQKKDVLSDDDVAAMLTATWGTELHVPALLDLEIGCRLGELVALKWADIDLDAGTVKVAHLIDRVSLERKRVGERTKVKERVIPISKEMVKDLKGHRAHLAEKRMAAPDRWADEGWVFPSLSLTRGRVMGRLWTPTAFNQAWTKLRLPWTFHQLRHTAITRWRRNGIPLEVAQYLAGHSSPNILLEVYRHVSREEVEAVRALMV